MRWPGGDVPDQEAEWVRQAGHKICERLRAAAEQWEHAAPGSSSKQVKIATVGVGVLIMVVIVAGGLCVLASKWQPSWLP
jgi:hypothetical protein